MPRDDGETTAWDWFKLGCLFGAIYSLIRNPQGVACCLGCVGLVALLLVLAVAAVAWPYWEWLLFGAALLAAVRLWQVRKRR